MELIEGIAYGGIGEENHRELGKIFKADRAHKLPTYPEINILVKTSGAVILRSALYWRAKKCITWFLQNGVNPNERCLERFSLLMYACNINCSYKELAANGACVELSDVEWRYIFDIWKYTSSPDVFFSSIGKMFSLGLRLPENQPYIPPPCYEAYEVILAREAACRRACYAVLLYFNLPKDITRWLLRAFVFPSRREFYWSELKMPKGFE